ncbi:MAG TPA: hypothetical protein VNT60_01265, partial [Deinococcales bacterium]|nr:hypothetical protein [Deinococcales bacterium]
IGCAATPAPPALPVVVTSIDGRLPSSPLPDEAGFLLVEGWPAERVPVRADGTFSLPLPETRAGSPIQWEEGSCDGQVTVSDPSVQYEELLQVLPWKGSQSFPVVRSAATEVARTDQYGYLYATGLVVVAGTQVCPETGGEVNHFDLKLGRGWNLYRFTVVRTNPRRYEYVSVLPRVLDWK